MARRKNSPIKRIIKFFSFLNNAFFLLFVSTVPLTFFDWGSERSYTFVLPFFVSLIGMCFLALFVIVGRQKIWLEKITICLALVTIFLFLQSLLCSIALSSLIRPYLGQSPILSGIRQSIYISHALLLILYVYLESKLADLKWFHIAFLVGLGVFTSEAVLQTLFILGVRPLSHVIDFLAALRISHPSSYFAQYGRPCASAPEAAHMTQLIFFYFLPYGSLVFVSSKSGLIKVGLISCVVLVIPCAVLATSTELVAITGIFVLCWLFISVRSLYKKRRYFVAGSVIIVFILLAIVVFGSQYVEEVVFDKVFSQTAYSVQKRFSHIYNGLLVFVKSPGFGVGAGNAAFFYEMNIVDTWFMNSYEVEWLVLGQNGLPTAAPMIPYFLSSYGIFGTFIFLATLYLLLKDSKWNLPLFVNRIYLVCFICLLWVLVFSDNIIANYYFGAFLCFPIYARRIFKSMNVLVLRKFPGIKEKTVRL